MALFLALHVMTAVLSWGSTTMVKVLFTCPVVGDPSGDPFLYRLSTLSGFPPLASHNIVTSSPDNTSVVGESRPWPATSSDRWGGANGPEDIWCQEGALSSILTKTSRSCIIPCISITDNGMRSH